VSETLSQFYSSTAGLAIQLLGAGASLFALFITAVSIMTQLEVLPLRWRNAVRAADRLISLMAADNWFPDFVICLGRSGAIWGGYLAGNFGSKPAFIILDDYSPDRSYVTFEYWPQLTAVLRERAPKKVAVIQGYSGTGGTFFAFRDEIRKRSSFEKIDFRYASVFAWRGCRFKEHHYIGKELRKQPRRMPWHTSDRFVTAMGQV
jgi:hypothetical protein